MDKEEILQIIKQGENETIEFKTSFGKEVIESIVAFSNTKGGKIIVGVNDNKNIAGITVADESIQNCKEYGIHEPKFEEIFNGFKVTLFKQMLNDTKDVTKDVIKDVTKENREDIIIHLIQKKPEITILEMANWFKTNPRTILREIEKLKSQNKICRKGGRKNGHWELTNQ